jgi:putative flippase GtrA
MAILAKSAGELSVKIIRQRLITKNLQQVKSCLNRSNVDTLGDWWQNEICKYHLSALSRQESLLSMQSIRSFIARHRRFITYGLIGITGASIDFILFAKLANYMHYLTANSISVSAGITNNFILNTFFNFKVKDRLFVRFLSFYSIGLFGLVVSSILLTLFISTLGLNHLLSKLFTTFFVAVMQYMLNKRLTFRVTN